MNREAATDSRENRRADDREDDAQAESIAHTTTQPQPTTGSDDIQPLPAQQQASIAGERPRDIQHGNPSNTQYRPPRPTAAPAPSNPLPLRNHIPLRHQQQQHVIRPNFYLRGRAVPPTRLYLTQPAQACYIPPTFGWMPPAIWCYPHVPYPVMCSDIFEMRRPRRSVIAEYPVYYRSPQRALVWLVGHQRHNMPRYQRDSMRLAGAFQMLGGRYSVASHGTNPVDAMNCLTYEGMQDQLRYLNEQHTRNANALFRYDAVIIITCANGNRQYMELENDTQNIISKSSLADEYADQLPNLVLTDTPALLLTHSYPSVHEYCTNFLPCGSHQNANILNVYTFGNEALNCLAQCLEQAQRCETINNIVDMMTTCLNRDTPGTVAVYDVGFKQFPIFNCH